MASTQTAAVDCPFWDERLETRSRADGDALVTAKINILPPDALPRATHKAKRVEDRRQNVWS
jgi:hypothetical protein